MDVNNLKKEICKIENEIGYVFEEISEYIFKNPELSGEEVISSKYLVEVLKGYGFEVKYPYCGLPTAFRAEIGDKNTPAVAFLAEYDALPNIGENGQPAHACGHNWISATTLGAAIVLSKIKQYVNGRIVVIGTPAEETIGNKFEMIERGAFKDINTVIQFHLDNGNQVNTRSLAMDAVEFTFKGKASHAASSPENGINALDAVNLTFSGINALRQHVRNDVRIHGIITRGGDAPNVVPDLCQCRFYIRASKRKYLNEVTQKVVNCAKGAELMTGAVLSYRNFENPFDDQINNSLLMDIGKKNLKLAGTSNFIEEEEECPGSSDIGNVSYVCPTLYCNIDVESKVACHEREFLDLLRTPKITEKLHMSIKAMAYIAVEILNEPGLIEVITEIFKKQTEE